MDSPPYDLAGLCIIAWLHLGDPISNVTMISNRLTQLFPSLQSEQLQEQVLQVFNANSCMFLYVFEQPLDLRWLNYLLVTEENLLLKRNNGTGGNGFDYHMYRPSLFSIIMEHGFVLRIVKNMRYCYNKSKIKVKFDLDCCVNR